MKRNICLILVSILLVLSTVGSLSGCGDNSVANSTVNNPPPSSDVETGEVEDVSGGEAINLMAGYEKGDIIGLEPDSAFDENQWRLAMALFKSMNEANEQDNVLISPLSIQLALAMTANGAKGQTRDEMVALLGGEYTLESLNEYLLDYVENLPSSEKYKLEIANSIWLKQNGIIPNGDFLQTNKNYYDSEIYSAPFDKTTVTDINNWVNENTDGLIKELIDEIGKYTIMYLINAIVFDAEWAEKYSEDDIYDDFFTTEEGVEQAIEMMYSIEYTYIEANGAKGFKKNYKDGKYSFVALLPGEGMSVDEYIATLTGEEILHALNNPDYSKIVIARMPKFSYDYSLTMNGVLTALGMPTAFDGIEADFSEMGVARENIYISKVLHKTFISVDEAGTKAGAVTGIVMDDFESEIGYENEVVITLDRPFVYMIIENETNTPIFMGTLDSINN